MPLEPAMFPEWNEPMVRRAQSNKHEAMERVETHASRVWLDKALDAGIAIARARPEFTADPIWTLLDNWGVPGPHEHRAIGPVMLRLVKSGICVKTDRTVTCSRPERNGGDMRVYRSLLYRPTELGNNAGDDVEARVQGVA